MTTQVDSPPAVPRLAGVQEGAVILGVSKQRFSTMRREHERGEAGSRPDFPEPVLELACGPLWRVEDLEAFLSQWDRRRHRHARADEDGDA